MEGTFKENETVWAKMAGYSHWPAIVMKPDPLAPSKPNPAMQWIYFLGTHNYAWIDDKNIKPYDDFKSQYKKKNTESAMEEMEDIIENLRNDPNYKIPFAVYISKRSAPKSRKSSTSSKVTPKKDKEEKPPTEKKTSEKKPPKRALGESNTPVAKKKSRTSVSKENDVKSSEYPREILEERQENSYGSQKAVTLNTFNLGTSQKFFGFLAGNIYADGLIKNLIKSGHRLYVWSQSTAYCDELQEFADKQQTFFKICNTPRQVVRNADITFSCLDDPEQAQVIINELRFSEKDDLLKGKGYVEMTSVEPETSKNFDEIIRKKDGVYLEAMLQGNRQESERGEVIILAAGVQSLFVDCQSCFKAMGKASFLLGNVGSAAKIHMIFQMMRGVFLASLAEGFAMADRCSIKLDAFNNIFKMTHMSSDYLKSKSDTIVYKKFSLEKVEEPLKQLQRDMAQGLDMSQRFKQPMPLASNANEILKTARRIGMEGQDSACIFSRRY